MLNDKLVELEKYSPIINYLEKDLKVYGNIEGWHCALRTTEVCKMVHVQGAKSPQIALNEAVKLLENEQYGNYKIDDMGNVVKRNIEL